MAQTISIWIHRGIKYVNLLSFDWIKQLSSQFVKVQEH